MSEEKPNFEDSPVDPQWVKGLQKFSQRELDRALRDRARSGFNLHVATLLKNGANLFDGGLNPSALHLAVDNGHYKTVEAILDKCPPKDLSAKELFLDSFENRHCNIMALLIERGFDPQEFKSDILLNTEMDASGLALTGAASLGDLNTVKKLIDYNLVTDRNYHKIAADYASGGGYLDILNYLLTQKVDPENIHMMTNTTHETVLNHIKHNQAECLAFMDNKNAFKGQSIDSLRENKGYIGNDLTLAARTKRFTELLQELSENNTLTITDFKKKDRYGFTLIELLADSGELKNLFKAEYWYKNQATAEQLVTLTGRNNPNISSEIEIFISEINQYSVKKASLNKPLKLKNRPPKM